jgi:hypothetical protein
MWQSSHDEKICEEFILSLDTSDHEYTRPHDTHIMNPFEIEQKFRYDVISWSLVQRSSIQRSCILVARSNIW